MNYNLTLTGGRSFQARLGRRRDRSNPRKVEKVERVARPNRQRLERLSGTQAAMLPEVLLPFQLRTPGDPLG